MKRLLRYFLQGLVITVPLLLTVFVCVQAFRKVDSWLGISVDAAGYGETGNSADSGRFLPRCPGASGQPRTSSR